MIGDERANKVEELSVRQKEILRLIAKHFERKEIARRLNISAHTVKAHIDAARKRLGVGTDRQAARFLAEYEAAHPPTFLGQSLPEVMAEPAETNADLGHEQDLRPERRVHDDHLERVGDSHAYAGVTRQTSGRGGLSSDGSSPLSDAWTGEGSFQFGGIGGVADDRWRWLTGRGERRNIAQSVGIVILLAIGLAIAFVVLVGGGATTMQAIQNLTGQTG
jgi:DNA-binding CsgD family transcriptional regulator